MASRVNHMGRRAAIGIVSGSGLDLTGLLDTCTAEEPFARIAGLAPSTVRGHGGRLLWGWRGSLPVTKPEHRLAILLQKLDLPPPNKPQPLANVVAKISRNPRLS